MKKKKKEKRVEIYIGRDRTKTTLFREKLEFTFLPGDAEGQFARYREILHILSNIRSVKLSEEFIFNRALIENSDAL